MIIGKIENGIVLDHITAGNGMRIYSLLRLDELDCQIAIIKNAESPKMGKKDIIKIDQEISVDLDAIGYIDPGVTVNYIEGGKLAKRKHLEKPETVTDIIKCKNPRCITTIEQELPHIFKLTDRDTDTYRCIYCESKAK